MKYSIILADCPWMYQNFSEDKNGAAKSHYDCLSVESLSSLPIKQISEDNSVLFQWATFPKMKEAIEVMEAWGFEYKTCAFVWNKTYKDGRPSCGLGFYTRSGAEVCLLGTRGKPLPRISHNVYQVESAAVTKHSAKPPIFRDKILQLFGDKKKIELFARPPIVDGWKMIGNEITGRDIKEDLKNIIEDQS